MSDSGGCEGSSYHMMLHRFAPGFAESQEGRAVLLLPTFSSLRSKRLVSRCQTCSAGQQHSAGWMVPLLTPTPPRGSGLSDSGSVCAESASSHSVPEIKHRELYLG